MNIKGGYISKKVTFDTQDSSDEKIYRLTSMISKLTAEDDDQTKQFKQKIYQSKRRGQRRNFCVENMVRGIIKIDISQIVGTEEYCSVVEYSMDRITETDKGIIRIRGDFRIGNFRGNLQSNQNY